MKTACTRASAQSKISKQSQEAPLRFWALQNSAQAGLNFRTRRSEKKRNIASDAANDKSQKKTEAASSANDVPLSPERRKMKAIKCAKGWYCKSFFTALKFRREAFLSKPKYAAQKRAALKASASGKAKAAASKPKYMFEKEKRAAKIASSKNKVFKIFIPIHSSAKSLFSL